ncbi:MAG: hypothetical protein ACLQIB_51110 [Isosphaeraceae bacterium]
MNIIFSIAQAIPVLPRDSGDFEDLHDLIMAASGHHAGIMIVRFDNDPRHNLTDRGISTALSKLESSRVPIADRIHVLNQWFGVSHRRIKLCYGRQTVVNLRIPAKP